MTASAGTDTVGARLADVAGRIPDRTALIEGACRTDFGRLDAAATVIARHILAAGNDRPGRVCLFFESKRPAIESIFGAGRSGHAYIPLDAGDPEERLRFIVQDSEPVALLTEGALLERARAVAPAGCAVLDVERLQAIEEARPLPVVDPDALIYLYYTSGSTGRPKGVGQTHRNLLFFSDAYARSLAVAEGDRLSLLYTLSFNAANVDIFGGLLHGATLCAYDVRREGVANLADWLDRERITVMHTVPTVFRELGRRLPAGRVLPHLRAIDLGGESVFASDIELFLGHTLDSCTLVNQLASTEVGLIAQHVVRHGSAPAFGPIVPVGRCPPGVHVDVLGDDGLPVTAGAAGEIVISSPYVSPGYWRRPDLDAAAFSADPQRPGYRRYFSGDLGRRDDAGNLHFLGRKGNRVKIRGHSVETMEVEAALCACPGVIRAAVIARGGEAPTEPVRLVAYLVAGRDAEHDPPAVRRHLARRLPAYMMPAELVFLESLPLTATGKTDRRALAQTALPPAAPAREIEPPRDDVERTVAGIFEQLLKLSPIGRTDDFFLLGGDSLLGVELQTQLRSAFGIHAAGLHEAATVDGIAAGIRRERQARSMTPQAIPVLIPLWRQGSAPPLFLIHGRHGQAFVSPHFMKLLGDDQPVWALQARGLDGLREPHSTVEAMAADYLAEVRSQRPHGPYFLGALCAGAYVAAAMARALREAGEAVLPLLLLDPPERLLIGGYSQMSEERFVSKMKARRALGRTAGPVDDPGYMRAVIRVAMAFEQAIARYRPQPYDGPVYMLSSRQRMQGAEATGLRQVFAGSVTRFEVGTTHAEALDPRNPVFANHLLRCIGLIRDAADGAAEASAVARAG